MFLSKQFLLGEGVFVFYYQVISGFSHGDYKACPESDKLSVYAVGERCSFFCMRVVYTYIFQLPRDTKQCYSYIQFLSNCRQMKAYFVRNSHYFRKVAKLRALSVVSQSECKAIVTQLQIYLPELVVSESLFSYILFLFLI